MDSSSTSHSNISPVWNLSNKTAVLLIEDITNILAEFSWVYSTRNTEIFVHDVLEKIPSEWIEAVIPLPASEYKLLPFGYVKDDWPLSFKKFVSECSQLAELRFPKCVIPLEKSTYSADKNVPLKKQTEIAALSNLIHHICKEVKCHKVLDIGSGLGYLDQFLHHNFGFQCVGLDAAKKKTESAKCRLEGDPCINSMYHETMFVKSNEDSIEKLQIILKNAHNVNPTCGCSCSIPCDSGNEGEASAFVMVGLHCCGSLMQDMMKLFCHMNQLKAFVCMGCCYNKINMDDFPMSEGGQSAVSSASKKHPGWYPCVSGLRVGSHATRTELRDLTPVMLQNTEKGLIYRGILEIYINNENFNWRKPKRRVRLSDLTDFEKYCDSMLRDHKQVFSDSEKSEQKRKLNEIYSSKEELFPRVRVLLILQILLQPLWESFVLLDRMLYFQEKSIAAEVYAVFDDSISPRNMALCAYKS